MTPERAISLLQGTATPLPPENHPEWEELAKCLEQHPDLDEWFRHASPVDDALRSAYTAIIAPRPSQILDAPVTLPRQGSALISPPRRQFLKTAASLAIGAGAAWWLLAPRRSGPLPYAAAATVKDFRQDIAEYCAGHYQLDIKGVSLDDAAAHLSHAGATSPCGLPEGIRKHPVIGCKVLEWRGRKVGMTCFNCGSRDVVHIFTVHLEAFTETPDPAELAKPVVCCERETAGWIADSRLHLAVAAKPGNPIADLVS